MATAKLGLPIITGNMTADVVRDVNAVANGVEAKVGVAGGLTSYTTCRIRKRARRAEWHVGGRR